MKHGTTSGYKTHGCRCPDCTRAVVAYQRAYKQRVRENGLVMVDASETGDHIRRLRESRISYAAIAAETGIATWHLRAIAAGKHRRVWPQTADAILSIPIHSHRAARSVDGRLARRLIDELGRAGITQIDVARMLQYRSPSCLAISRRTYVMRRTWDRLVVIYRHFAALGIVPASVLEEVGE